LTREEDWSDWLIYLISESQTGYFSSLLISNEPLSWKVWAYSFLGAIEQKLLYFKNKYSISDILEIENNIFILKEGLLNG